MRPVGIQHFEYFTCSLRVIFHCKATFPKCSRPFKFACEQAFLISNLCYITLHLIFLNFMTLVIFGEGQTFLIDSLRNFIHLATTVSLLKSNTFLRTSSSP